MKATDHQEFQYTPEGLERAREFAKSIGKLEELDARGNGFSTDGYSQVHQCNLWYNEQQSQNKENNQ